MNRYKNLEIWKRSVAYASEIYKITASFPNEERFGLMSQMRRAAVSIPSNIAEGAARTSKKEFNHFLDIAYGSLHELETQILISFDLGYLEDELKESLCDEVTQIQKMTYTFSKKLKSQDTGLETQDSGLKTHD